MTADPQAPAPVLELRRRTRRDRRSQIREDCYRQAWITVAEAAHISGLSIEHVRDLCQRDKIRARKFGAYRIEQLSLQQYLGG